MLHLKTPGTLAALAPALTTLRLSLHVLAAAVFVGGQVTLVGLLPTLRSLGGSATKQAARAFGRLQWPAYGILVATGIWNAIALHPGQQSGAWNAVFIAKIVVAAAAGISALLHARARSRAGLAAFGGIAGITSLAALILGVILAG